MHAVGTDRRRQVGTVVEDEWHLMAGADLLDDPGPSHQIRIGEVLVAELHDVDPADDASLYEGPEIGPVGGAEIEPTLGQGPSPGGGPGGGIRQLVAIAWALAWAFFFCLN